MNTRIARLEKSLKNQFGPEAPDLAAVITQCLDNECTPYADIDLPIEDKNEALLTAFEERAVVPIQKRPSQGWDSCGLRLTPDESYFIPRVVRILFTTAQETGRLDPDQAVRDVLSACSAADTESMAALFAQAKKQVRSFKLEAGLLHQVLQEMDNPVDLHASMDTFVLAGMMSPCTGMSVPSGLAWFEVNRCLFWK
jgi:hypothetical protein